MFQLNRSFDPFRELDALVNYFAEGPFHRYRVDNIPAMNVWQNDDGVVIKADLPGMDADSLDVSVEGDVLTVGGEFTDDTDESVQFQRRERTVGKFSRSIHLPFEVDASTASATYEKGVLTLKMARPEEQRPRKITVQAV